MRKMSELSFARPIAHDRSGVFRKWWEQGREALSDEEDERMVEIAGVAPGFPEAFATAESRDAALGPYGGYVEFIPATWSEAERGGFSVASVAIGHGLDDPAFNGIAAGVLDAVAELLRDDDWADIVVQRMRHTVRRLQDGTLTVTGGMPEFGVPGDVEGSMRTALYLQAELARRLESAHTA